MNNSEILSKVFDLKDLILNSELYIELKDKEKIEKQKEIILLNVKNIEESIDWLRNR